METADYCRNPGVLSSCFWLVPRYTSCHLSPFAPSLSTKRHVGALFPVPRLVSPSSVPRTRWVTRRQRWIPQRALKLWRFPRLGSHTGKVGLHWCFNQPPQKGHDSNKNSRWAALAMRKMGIADRWEVGKFVLEFVLESSFYRIHVYMYGIFTYIYKLIFMGSM